MLRKSASTLRQEGVWINVSIWGRNQEGCVSMPQNLAMVLFFSFIYPAPSSYYTFLHLLVHLRQHSLLIKGFHDLPWLRQIIPIKSSHRPKSIFYMEYIMFIIFYFFVWYSDWTFNWIKSHGERKQPSYHCNWHSNRYAYSWYTINIKTIFIEWICGV